MKIDTESQKLDLRSSKIVKREDYVNRGETFKTRTKYT